MPKHFTPTLICSLTLLFALGSVAYYRHLQQTKNVLHQHCLNINEDVTRIESRRCIKPLTLENNLFRFMDEEGVIAKYEIVSTKADVYNLTDNLFYYNFVSYEEE